jgi:hypothetical protein
MAALVTVNSSRKRNSNNTTSIKPASSIPRASIVTARSAGSKKVDRDDIALQSKFGY